MRQYFKAHKRAAATAPEPGECPICRRTRPLVQDHCHASGLCRDRICNSCNVLIGRLESQPERLQILLDYISRWRWEHAHGGQPYPPQAGTIQ